MKAMILKSQGDVDQLVGAELPIPKPKKDEVLLKVHAIGINPTDVYVRQNIALDHIFNS